MMFSKYHIRLIEAGCKWQTRRFIGGRKPGLVGHVQGIRSNYKEHPVGYIRILALYKQRLVDSADLLGDIRAEGYASVRAYLQVFCALNHLPDPYRPGADSLEYVQLMKRELWVVVFEYAGKMVEWGKPEKVFEAAVRARGNIG